MKEEFNRYGARLSDAEYGAKIAGLYKDAPAMPTKEQDLALQRAELNLSLDHKLGIDFPDDKREAMWQVTRDIRRSLWRLPFLSLKEAFKTVLFKKDLEPSEEHWGAMAAYAMKKFGKVLDDEELEQFLSIKADGITPKKM